MRDITDVFLHILHQYGSVDMAEAEFKKMINEDSELRTEYREWCDAVGSSEKNGFLDFCKEYMDSQESIYDTLNDYDE